MRQFWRTLQCLVRRSRLEHELDEEMRFHLEMRAADDSEHAARRRFGNITLWKEVSREMWGWRSLEVWLQDLRYAGRVLLRNRAFSAVAILSLALGVGANTAIFTLVNTLLLKTLPVDNPRELVLLRAVNRHGFRSNFSHRDYVWIRDRNEVCSGLLASGGYNNLEAEIDGQTARVRARIASGNYFAVLGVPAMLGRTLASDDDDTVRPVAVISHAWWKRRFALDPGVLGRAMRLSRVSFTIVGVAPPEFFGETVGDAPDVWVPLAMQPQLNSGASMLNRRSVSWLEVMGRLKTGIDLERGRAGLAVTLAQIQAANHIDGRNDYLNHIGVEPGAGGFAWLRERYSLPLRVLMGAVVVLLLIACTNVANLMLARATRRQREMAVRMALGAGRMRLIRQIFTESLLLALGGAMVGLLFARWGARGLVLLISNGPPIPLDIHPDIRVLGFTATVSVFAAILFAIAPAIRGTAVDPEPALRRDSRSLADAGGRRGAGLLVVSEIALSVVLMAGAVLFVRTLANLRHMDMGFHPDHVLRVGINQVRAGYSGPRMAQAVTAVLQKLRGLGGVRSASVSALGFDGGRINNCCIVLEGIATGADQERGFRSDRVGPAFFQTFGITVQSGREFDWHDVVGAPKVAVINETMARYYFPDYPRSSPVGRGFGFQAGNEFQIVGVVKDARYNELRESTPRMAYFPYFQNPAEWNQFEIRTIGPPLAMVPQIRRAIQETEPQFEISNVRTLSDEVERTISAERAVATLASLFGLLALALVAIGIYGVLSYAVARRTSEIGLRIALGARRGAVVTMVLRDLLRVLAPGAAAGILAAIAAGRLVSSMLFEVSVADPTAMGAAIAIVTAAAALAAYLPARRAARVDPMVALRYE
jgi:predicted permease